jgi:hypothetical protein
MSDPQKAFLNRKAQWNKFHEWKSSSVPLPISIEERVAWYSAAFRFSQKWSHPIGLDEILVRVNHLQMMQFGLVPLSRFKS